MVNCKCGCGKEIEIKPHHKYSGIPKYIQGHQHKNKVFSKTHRKNLSIATKKIDYGWLNCTICKKKIKKNSFSHKFCKSCYKKYRKKYFNEWQKTQYYKYHSVKKEYARVNNRRNRRKYRELVLSVLGNKCCICGFTDWRALQIDHINGDGSIERKTIPIIKYYKKVIKEYKNNKYQLLCANCNWIKRYENNELSKLNMVTKK